MPANSPLIVVLGPTGSGKSVLAISLGRAFNAEIVNCDSVQVYRGLDIGSAKASPEQREQVPHHLLDIVDPASELSAGAYAELARQALIQITARGRLPIIAGGTGFYLRSLLNGLSPAPKRDPNLRQRLDNVAKRRPNTLHRLLTRRDPGAASRIHPNDHQKLIRAIEISAEPAPLGPRQPLSGYSILKIGLNPPRPELYQRLNERTSQMFHGGLLAEVRTLLEAGLAADAKSLQTLGYKQALQIISAQATLDQAIIDCQARTRQYAKRQLTWFRREPDVQWLSGFGTDSNVQSMALDLVKGTL